MVTLSITQIFISMIQCIAYLVSRSPGNLNSNLKVVWSVCTQSQRKWIVLTMDKSTVVGQTSIVHQNLFVNCNISMFLRSSVSPFLDIFLLLFSRFSFHPLFRLDTMQLVRIQLSKLQKISSLASQKRHPSCLDLSTFQNFSAIST